MGKNIIAQARGRGGPTYRAKSFRYQGRVKHNRFATDVQVGKIIDLLHCAGHSAPLAQVQFESGENNLMIAHEGMKVGDAVQLGGEAAVKDGNVLPLKNIPEGTLIFNIESIPGDGGKFVRSSGVFAKVVSKFGKNVVVQLPSKKRRPFPAACRASIGVIAAGGRPEKPLLKAGNAY
ncbi:MAG: 50S ribosomal protein L2, partial [Candidatus Nanoarchaeia archaeon]